MRLWHYKLIPYLPRQQLIAQWRELVCIAESIHKKETPNHILVNKIMDYPVTDFNVYCDIVLYEMVQRKYKVSESSMDKLNDYTGFLCDSDNAWKAEHNLIEIFPDWHTFRYLDQCMYNLEEKYDCDGISEEEWKKLCLGYEKITGNHFKNYRYY